MAEIDLSAGPIDYEDTGGDGPVVVLLHGLAMDPSLWRDVIALDYNTVNTHASCTLVFPSGVCARRLCRCWAQHLACSAE